MIKDKNGKEIKIGSYVMLLAVEPNWFSYESAESAKILHEACKKPVLVSDIDDGKVTIDLPSTLAEDGEYVGNGITTVPEKVEVV